MASSILIIGVGSPYRCDDSVGLIIVKSLEYIQSKQVRLIEHSGEGSDLMDVWKNYNYIFLIDAVQSGKPPGTIHRINAREEKVPTEFFHYSTHAFGVAEAVEMARALGEFPENLFIYGIEGKNFNMGHDMSPSVKISAKIVEKMLKEEIQKIINQEIMNA